MSLFAEGKPKKTGMSVRALVLSLLAIAIVSGAAYAATSVFITANVNATISPPAPKVTLQSVAITSSPDGSTMTCTPVPVSGSGSASGVTNCTAALYWGDSGTITVTAYANTAGVIITVAAQDSTSSPPVTFSNPSSQASTTTTGLSSSPFTFSIGYTVIQGTGTTSDSGITVTISVG